MATVASNDAAIAKEAQEKMAKFMAECYRFTNTLATVDCCNKFDKQEIIVPILKDAQVIVEEKSKLVKNLDKGSKNSEIIARYNSISKNNPLTGIASLGDNYKLYQYLNSFITYEINTLQSEHAIKHNASKHDNAVAANLSKSPSVDYKDITDPAKLLRWIENQGKNLVY